MPRPKAVNPPVTLKAMIPVELRAKLDLLLVSEVEGRIPLGEISAFITSLLRRHFEEQTLDLQPYGFPAGFFVRGPAEMLKAVRLSFEARRPTEAE